jgi:hypothetical protein
MLFPKPGVFPQTSHTDGITQAGYQNAAGRRSMPLV